jgi:hypothetical protein
MRSHLGMVPIMVESSALKPTFQLMSYEQNLRLFI